MTFVNHFKEKMISCKNETSNAEAEVEAAGFVMRLEISSERWVWMLYGVMWPAVKSSLLLSQVERDLSTFLMPPGCFKIILRRKPGV